VRKTIRSIFRTLCKIYPATKMFSFVIDGVKSKNSRQRAECLEELGLLIEFYNINVCHPTPAQAMKVMAGQICDRDNPVRTAALNSIVTAYNIIGDLVYKYVGKVRAPATKLALNAVVTWAVVHAHFTGTNIFKCRCVSKFFANLYQYKI